ncbi:hypothetical protein C8R47DRAFT_43655 [Mycena vitilis]|nr:hypothetical protein C8R47DRAFT_43655 [Mycena vitilis]
MLVMLSYGARWMRGGLVENDESQWKGKEGLFGSEADIHRSQTTASFLLVLFFFARRSFSFFLPPFTSSRSSNTCYSRLFQSQGSINSRYLVALLRNSREIETENSTGSCSFHGLCCHQPLVMTPRELSACTSGTESLAHSLQRHHIQGNRSPALFAFSQIYLNLFLVPLPRAFLAHSSKRRLFCAAFLRVSCAFRHCAST